MNVVYLKKVPLVSLGGKEHGFRRLATEQVESPPLLRFGGKV